MLRGPLIGLAAGHRPTSDQRHAADTEAFDEHAVLTAHVVEHRDLGKFTAGLLRMRVGRRTRYPVAEHIYGDDEVRAWIDRTPAAEEPFIAAVRARHERRQHNHVVFPGVELAIGFERELSVAQNVAGLQLDIAEPEDFVVQTVGLPD